MANGAPQDDDTPEPGAGGRLLARRYRLGTPVGRGGMGTVWGAYDEVLGRDVAVKEVVLPFGLTDEERDTQYKRTFREARTAARLGHPGVIAVYDVVEEDGRPWIVMELVRARSLDKVIKQDGVLDWKRSAEIGRQMLSALHAAHEAGVLHRDVKPSNVLLDDTGLGTGLGERAVLTDFGIATSVGDTTLTTTGLVLGSPAYIAPERARGKTIGPASDLWSLGVTLYAMLNGKSPFERAEPMASLVAIISDEPTYIEQAGPLWPVIEGLLRKDPDQRFTAQQAAMILDGVVRTGGAITIPAPRPEVEAASREAVPALQAAGNGNTTPPATLAETGTASTGETETGPDTVKVPEGGAVLAGRRGRVTMIWAVVALVVVLAGGAIAAFANSGDSGKPHHTLPAVVNPPATHNSASPRPTATASPAHTGVPDGYRAYKDDTGFRTVVPKDWTDAPRRPDGQVVIKSPDENSRVVFLTNDPTSSALDTLKNQGDQGQAQYSVIRVGPATSGPLADASGVKCAELEYTWESNNGKQHVLVRDFEANGHRYEIQLRAPADSWDSMWPTFKPVIDQFALS